MSGVNTSGSANDGLRYPTTFNEFMGVVDRWHRAREPICRPGEHVGDMLLRTSHELDDAVAIFRQLWANAQMKSEPYDAPLPKAEVGQYKFGRRAKQEADRLQRWMELCEKGHGQEVALEIRAHLEKNLHAQRPETTS